MKKIYPELPHWTFDVDEVSAGMYQVVGTDEEGHSVCVNGTDVDEIIRKCRQEAKNYVIVRRMG